MFICTFGSTLFKPHTAVGAASNGRIAYTAFDTQSVGQIYTSNDDGSDIQQITNDANNSSNNPVWSPDGTKIAYTGEDFGDQSSQIFVMNADGTNKVDLTNDDNTQNSNPTWSPDGTKIAYGSSPSDYSTPSTINVMHADGSNITVLTDGANQDWLPTWSPDGNKLTFIGYDGNSISQIDTMNTDGTNIQPITSGTTTNYLSVAYSPSGTEFAYTTLSTDHTYTENLGTMNTDGSNSHTITTSNVSNNNASWSPDGTKILYDDYDSTANLQRIYYINADGTNETAVSPDDQYAQGSSWQSVSASDTDGDSIANAVEDAAPNGGDANGDSTPDKNQANVTSFVDPVTNKYVSLQSNCTATTAVSAQTVPVSFVDPAFSYPAGLVGFTLTCGTTGATATVTQYIYGVTPLNTMLLRKYNSTTHSYTTIPGSTVTPATIGGQTVTKVRYQITDGGAFDQDGLANGVIVDPVGLAVPSVGTPNTGVGGSVLFPRSLAAPLL